MVVSTKIVLCLNKVQVPRNPMFPMHDQARIMTVYIHCIHIVYTLYTHCIYIVYTIDY